MPEGIPFGCNLLYFPKVIGTSGTAEFIQRFNAHSDIRRTDHSSQGTALFLRVNTFRVFAKMVNITWPNSLAVLLRYMRCERAAGSGKHHEGG